MGLMSNVENMGNISGYGNGLDITGAQRSVVNNEGATISSTSATGVNIDTMQGDLKQREYYCG
jgi:accessory colonization factor AcfC